MIRFKKPKCNPCKIITLNREAKDGEFVAVPDECINCNYYECNFENIVEKRK